MVSTEIINVYGNFRKFVATQQSIVREFVNPLAITELFATDTRFESTSFAVRHGEIINSTMIDIKNLTVTSELNIFHSDIITVLQNSILIRKNSLLNIVGSTINTIGLAGFFVEGKLRLENVIIQKSFDGFICISAGAEVVISNVTFIGEKSRILSIAGTPKYSFHGSPHSFGEMSVKHFHLTSIGEDDQFISRGNESTGTCVLPKHIFTLTSESDVGEWGSQGSSLLNKEIDVEYLQFPQPDPHSEKLTDSSDISILTLITILPYITAVLVLVFIVVVPVIYLVISRRRYWSSVLILSLIQKYVLQFLIKFL